MDNTEDRNQPRDILRDGNLKASIWRNEGEKGPFYSANLARVYRDDQGELRDSQSFSGGDLLRVSELARKTYDRTQELRREDRESERAADDRANNQPVDRDAFEQRKMELEASQERSDRSPGKSRDNR